MNDKQQLAAMGEHLAEQQPLCMAKRIEELEGQVRVMAELLAQASTQLQTVFERDPQHWDFHGLVSRIDAALAGKLPEPVMQEVWELVPVEPTPEMILAGIAAQAEKLKRYALGGSLHPIDHGMPDAYRAMLAAAPSPDSAK